MVLSASPGLKVIGSNAGFSGRSWMRTCRQPAAVTVFSEWYFLTVNRPPFSPAPSDANCTSTTWPSREPAGHGRNRDHEPFGMSGSIDVPVTRATNMPGFAATPGTSVPLSRNHAPAKGRKTAIVLRVLINVFTVARWHRATMSRQGPIYTEKFFRGF